MQPTIYVDANLGNQYDSQPQVGAVVMIAGGCIQASSHRPKLSCDSTAYAEMCAAVHGTKIAMQLTSFARDCRFQVAIPKLLGDSEATLKIGNNPLHPGRKQRHWRTRSDLVSEAVRRKRITFEKVPSEDNLSDILTKPVGGEYFESMAREICGAEPLFLPGTNIDIRHKNRVIKAAKADRELRKQKSAANSKTSPES